MKGNALATAGGDLGAPGTLAQLPAAKGDKSGSVRSLKELPREGLPVLAKRTKNKHVHKAAVQDLKIQMIWRGNLA